MKPKSRSAGGFVGRARVLLIPIVFFAVALAGATAAHAQSIENQFHTAQDATPGVENSVLATHAAQISPAYDFGKEPSIRRESQTMVAIASPTVNIQLISISRISSEPLVHSSLSSSPESSHASISRSAKLNTLQDPAQQNAKVSNKPRHHGAFLAMAIVGTIGVGGGIATLALAHSSHCSSPTAPGACNDLDTSGKVLIPVGAVMAGLGYFFAYHHN